mmetsp:Transcript_54964/g.170591  ORF Transcript_54964/g.170591 Transcript_54964/m.170591 type:complete len:269 (-) Transcript_54964:239-1045(-)
MAEEQRHGIRLADVEEQDLQHAPRAHGRRREASHEVLLHRRERQRRVHGRGQGSFGERHAQPCKAAGLQRRRGCRTDAPEPRASRQVEQLGGGPAQIPPADLPHALLHHGRALQRRQGRWGRNPGLVCLGLLAELGELLLQAHGEVSRPLPEQVVGTLAWHCQQLGRPGTPAFLEGHGVGPPTCDAVVQQLLRVHLAIHGLEVPAGLHSRVLRLPACVHLRHLPRAPDHVHAELPGLEARMEQPLRRLPRPHGGLALHIVRRADPGPS